MEQKESDWRWPRHGRSETDLMQYISELPEPYNPLGSDGERVPPPFCYPGTPLLGSLEPLLGRLMAMRSNNIGTHTHGNGFGGEGGFDGWHLMEREALFMLASVLGAELDEEELNRPNIDGFFCGGGTESNLQGLWQARQWLRQRPDPNNRGIVVMTTALTHYSVEKACDILDIGYSKRGKCPICNSDHVFVEDPRGTGVQMVALNNRGQMDVQDLYEQIRERYDQGFRRFAVVPTVGTTALGSVDPVDEISAVLDELKCDLGLEIYVHVDASFGGFTVPFVAPERSLWFQNKHVMSVTLDGDKMGHLPYPGGVFLCRKGMQGLIARQVEYVSGHNDDTLPGSRSAVTGVAAWFEWRRLGLEGHRFFVQQRLDARDRLRRMIEAESELRGVVEIRPEWLDNHVNFLPIVIDLEKGGVPDRLTEQGGVLAPYHLRSDFCPSGQPDSRGCPVQVYKICVMPHTDNWFAEFVRDLVTVSRSVR